jgi:hypothetical protein
MGWRIGLVGVLAAAFAGCLEPPAPGGAGDASVVDAAGVEGGGAVDRPDVPDVAIDLLSDPNNCGAPGVQCSRGLGRPLVRCEAGHCVCDGHWTACGSYLGCGIDLDFDNRHCGRCDGVCSPNTVCVSGRCKPCPVGYGTCGSSDESRCTTRLTAVNNCGACGRFCSSPDFCVDQICQGCPADHTVCPGRECVDLQTDPMNCGACGTPCLDDLTSTAVCAEGMCTRTCRPGFATCGASSACSTELASSNEHCGGCDLSCGALSNCIGGVCTSLAARPVAPLSPLILGVQHPRFRWQRADGVDGVRLQLCADRPCTHVESTRDLTEDEYRPDVALTPGVHFWRLFALRGGVVSVEPSPVWEFVVPMVDTRREVTGLLYDIDGDGIEDDFVGFNHQAVRHSAAPRMVQTIPYTYEPLEDGGHYEDRISPEFSGDIDGDGYGDLVGSHVVSRGLSGDAYLDRSCTLLRGGAPRFSTTPRDVGVHHSRESYGDFTGCGFVFDLDGDGHGDVVIDHRLSRSGTLHWVRFGGQDEWTTPASEVLDTLQGSYSGVRWGDFNGDGRADLVHISYDGSQRLFATINVISFARGVDSPVFLPLPQCSLPSSAPLNSPYGSDSTVIVDANGDGFDDIRVSPAFGGIATYLGGPAGFTRCVYEPARH